MGHMHHFSAGWLSPVLSYAMACVGSALGLRCTVRALTAEGRSRRNWLLTASVAIGSGIWTMHFIAMLGFGVTGSAIRYDVPLTLLSLLVAVLVVGAGVFTVGYGPARLRSLLLGGLGTGLGVAAMHYLGMAALRLHGRSATTRVSSRSPSASPSLRRRPRCGRRSACAARPARPSPPWSWGSPSAACTTPEWPPCASN